MWRKTDTRVHSTKQSGFTYFMLIRLLNELVQTVNFNFPHLKVFYSYIEEII